MLDVVVDAVAERMLRYDPAGEFDFHDDFGWLDITHGLTYANATRWHAGHAASGRLDRRADAVRLALWCVFLAHWTGRHEWHAGVGEPVAVDLGTTDLVAAGRGAAAPGARRHDDGVHRPRPRREDVAGRGRGGRPARVVASAGGDGPVPGGPEAGALRGLHGHPFDRLPLRPGRHDDG